MKLVRGTKTPEQFAALRDGLEGFGFFKLAHAPLGRRYYAAAAGPEHADDSFVLTEKDRAIALIECDAAAGKLARFGLPIEIRLRPEADWRLKAQAIREALGELRRIAELKGSGAITLRTSAECDPDGLIASQLIGARAVPGVELRSEADLSLSEAELRDDLRKGHRQQIRWGETSLRMSFVNAASPDFDSFDRFRVFHAEVAGRVTRPAESWRAMFDFLLAGQGEAVFAELDGKLVGATMILDAGDTAYYASGVYDRAQFDKPLGHYTIFTSMLRAKARGLRRFDVGEIPYDPGEANDKERAIGYFKHGFSSRMRTSVVWRLKTPGAQ